MTDTQEQIQELVDLLGVACGLIMVEARDHAENHQIEKDRRKSISQTLEAFCKKAREVVIKIDKAHSEKIDERVT